MYAILHSSTPLLSKMAASCCAFPWCSSAATAAVAGYKRYQDEGEHKEEFMLNGLLWKIVGFDWQYARENVYGKITGV